MLAYRAFPYKGSAAPGKAGHATYLYKPQGRGRIDNPAHYDLWYLALTPEAAVGEVFADLPVWSSGMFEFPAIPGSRRSLATFKVPDSAALLDLDDARNLFDGGLPPTQVVSRLRPVTQGWALRIFDERNDAGERTWAGVRWWSVQRPPWTILGLWVEPGTPLPFDLVSVSELDVNQPAVVDAAASLGKLFR